MASDTEAGATRPDCNHQAVAPFVRLGFSAIPMAKPLSCVTQASCMAH